MDKLSFYGQESKIGNPWKYNLALTTKWWFLKKSVVNIQLGSSWRSFLLHDTKEHSTFVSCRLGRETNPDLAFASTADNDQLSSRRALKKFLQWKQWNYWNADWKRYSFVIDQLSSALPSPKSPDTFRFDDGYHDFCMILILAAKQTIPLGDKRNYYSLMG